MLALDPNLRFRLNQLLIRDADLVRLVRLLVATRHLTGLTRALTALIPSESPDDQEAIQVLTLHLVGAAKEAADRFRDCDSNGLWSLIEESGEHGDQFRGELATARSMTNKKDDKSLYARVLKPFRDDVAFHVQGAAVERALEALKEEDFTAATVDDQLRVLEVPLASAVMMAASWVKSPLDTLEPGLIEDVLTLQRVLRSVVHDHYLLLVRLSTMSDAP